MNEFIVLPYIKCFEYGRYFLQNFKSLSIYDKTPYPKLSSADMTSKRWSHPEYIRKRDTSSAKNLCFIGVIIGWCIWLICLLTMISLVMFLEDGKAFNKLCDRSSSGVCVPIHFFHVVSSSVFYITACQIIFQNHKTPTFNISSKNSLLTFTWLFFYVILLFTQESVTSVQLLVFITFLWLYQTGRQILWIEAIRVI
jgi:hypothetical protein